jgi:hypothetical protein
MHINICLVTKLIQIKITIQKINFREFSLKSSWLISLWCVRQNGVMIKSLMQVQELLVEGF